MKLEVSEEFVKEAHKSACQTWKTRIEEEFPSLFAVKPIIGKWFKSKKLNNKFMAVTFDEIMSRNMNGYGVDYKCNWIDEINLDDDLWGDFIEATPQEIESMLWKEAEKRGFKEGVRYENARYGNLEYADNGVFEYDDSSDSLWLAGNSIYYKGKWAKPLDPNKEIKEQISRLEKELKELNEKVK